MQECRDPCKESGRNERNYRVQQLHQMEMTTSCQLAPMAEKKKKSAKLHGKTHGSEIKAWNAGKHWRSAWRYVERKWKTEWCSEHVSQIHQHHSATEHCSGMQFVPCRIASFRERRDKSTTSTMWDLITRTTHAHGYHATAICLCGCSVNEWRDCW